MIFKRTNQILFLTALCASVLYGTFLYALDLAVPADNLEGKLISGIGISGNYPYIENRIKRYLTIRPSNEYNQQVATEQIERIKSFYTREGWIDTEVSISPEYIPTTDSIYLNLKIKKGFLLRYGNISVTGTYSLPASLVASMVNTWLSYTPRRLRESVHKIIATYRSNGYPLARVRVADKKTNLITRHIDVSINIEEGPHVRVAFSGNKALGGKILAKTVTIFKEGAIDSYELGESSRAIQKRYMDRGFPNATVKFMREELSSDSILITFYIEEGVPERIRNISFTGNDKMSSTSLRKKSVSKELSLFHPGIYNPKILKYDTVRLDQFYQKKGFPAARAEAPLIDKLYNDTQLNITLPIKEGIQYIVGEISFIGDVKFTRKKLLKQIEAEPEKPVNYTILEAEKDAIVLYYGDNGYPYAVVALEVVENQDSGIANLVFNINSGPEVRFGALSYVGDFITSQKAIKKSMSAREGELFSYKKLAESKNALRRLDAFANVNIQTEGLDEKATVIPMTVRVEEMRPFRLDFDVGYSTDELLVAGITFVNRNSFGWGKRTALSLIGGRRLSRGELSWTDPRLLGYDLEMTLASWLQYENKAVFSYIQNGGGIGLYRRYHRTSFLTRVNLTRNYFVLGSSTAADAQSLRDNTLFNTLLSINFDTRNNFADPTTGVIVNGYANFFNEVRGNNAHFVKLGGLGGYYLSFLKRLTLANDVRFEGIETFGHNVSVPSNELFLLGGEDTVRGFDRDSLGPVNTAGRPTGGRIRFICNNELRIGLFKNFKWVLFHDMGFLTNNFEQISVGTLRHSVGFGLHYITPIGPIKADYGFILARRPNEDMGRFSLSFGYIF